MVFHFVLADSECAYRVYSSVYDWLVRNLVKWWIEDRLTSLRGRLVEEREGVHLPCTSE